MAYKPDANIENEVATFLFGANYTAIPNKKLVWLPGGNTGQNPDADGGGAEACYRPSLFHRDELGNTCFTEDEATRASEHIAAMALDERVKSCLQKKRFELPQHSETAEAFFCNESVYGNVNILWVTGVVRMSPDDVWTFDRVDKAKAAAASSSGDGAGAGGGGDDEKSSKKKKFNAWPSKSARKLKATLVQMIEEKLAKHGPYGHGPDGY